MSDSPPRIQVAPELPPGQRRRQPTRKLPPPWVYAGLAWGVAIALGLGMLVRSPQEPSPPDPIRAAAEQGDSAPDPPAAGDSRSLTADSSAGSNRLQADASTVPPTFQETPAEDDGELLWISPTTGTPVSLAYLPAGVQALLHLRAGELAAHPEGARVLAALGPWGAGEEARLRELAGGAWDPVETLLLTLVVNDDNRVEACLRVELSQGWTAEELAARFPEAELRTNSVPLVVAGNRAWFLPAQEEGRVLVACPAGLADELIEAGSAPPLLVREIEQLASRTDAHRTVTALFLPRFFQGSASHILGIAGGPGERFAAAVDWLLGREAVGCIFSADLQDNLFLELRTTTRPTDPPQEYTRRFLERLTQAARDTEYAALATSWSVYGRRVIARFPSMLRKVAGYARRGVEQRQAVIRCYLPVAAAHNLTLASELWLSQQGRGAAGDSLDTASEPESATLEARMQQPAALVFAKETLERALELLAADLGVPIVIRGNDLQLEGITKNQSFGIDLRDRPFGEVLLEVLLRANPDRTAEGPNDPRQKLVWIVSEMPGDPSQLQIVVTTRTAAARRGEPLPPIFAPKTP